MATNTRAPNTPRQIPLKLLTRKLLAHGDMNQKPSVQHEEELLMHSHFPLFLPEYKQFFRTGETETGSKTEHE